MMDIKQKKSNAILEYTIVLGIIIAMTSGVTVYFKRHIQARVKDEWDSQQAPSTHAGLEWASSITFAKNSTRVEKDESFTGDKRMYVKSQSAQTTISTSTPSIKGWSVMEHKGAGMSAQDAPSSPPTPAYPSLTYVSWRDQGWQLY